MFTKGITMTLEIKSILQANELSKYPQFNFHQMIKRIKRFHEIYCILNLVVYTQYHMFILSNSNCQFEIVMIRLIYTIFEYIVLFLKGCNTFMPTYHAWKRVISDEDWSWFLFRVRSLHGIRLCIMHNYVISITTRTTEIELQDPHF